MPLKNWSSIHARCSKSSLKHSIRFCGIFPSLKQNFIAYRSSKVSSRPDCIFEIHLLWQSGFSRVYSNCYCSCSFETEIIKIVQSPHKMYSNNIVNFQESTITLNACTKNVWNLIECTTYVCVCVCVCILFVWLGWFVRWEVSGRTAAILSGIAFRICSKRYLGHNYKIFKRLSFVECYAWMHQRWPTSDDFQQFCVDTGCSLQNCQERWIIRRDGVRRRERERVS